MIRMASRMPVANLAVRCVGRGEGDASRAGPWLDDERLGRAVQPPQHKEGMLAAATVRTHVPERREAEEVITTTFVEHLRLLPRDLRERA